MLGREGLEWARDGKERKGQGRGEGKGEERGKARGRFRRVFEKTCAKKRKKSCFLDFQKKVKNVKT